MRDDDRRTARALNLYLIEADDYECDQSKYLARRGAGNVGKGREWKRRTEERIQRVPSFSNVNITE